MIEVNQIDIPDNIFDLPTEEQVEVQNEVKDEAPSIENEILEEKPVKENKKTTKKKSSKSSADNIAIVGTDITESMLEEYKSEYRKIYKTNLGGNMFVWHRLSRMEFSDVINESKDIEDRMEEIKAREVAFIKKACLYPSSEDLDQIFEDNEFIQINLSEEILYYSGIARPETTEL